MNFDSGNKGNPNYSKIIIYCDFDGTITESDTMNRILDRFADPSWLEYDELFLSGKMPSSECITKQISLLAEADHSEIDKLIENTNIDETFLTFYKACLDNKIPIVILSDGLDFYIKKILSKHSINLPVKSNIYLGAGKVDFPHKAMCNKGCANCKVSHLDEQLLKIYIGDGQSDYCVAKHCNIVFAKKRLAELLTKDVFDFTKYDSFSDILSELQSRNILS